MLNRFNQPSTRCTAIAIFVLTIWTLGCWSAKSKSLLSPDWKHCVHRLHALPTKWQDFQSENYPNGINKQTQCSWIISVSPPRRIRLAFYGLNLTGSMRNCFTQYMEIYEVHTRQSLGRFCGDQRPGDYVSHGRILRVDLLADTVAGKYEGFKMKYKATAARPGFKRILSFPQVKSKTSKTPTANRPAGGRPNPPVRNGGKVNLGLRRRLREQAKRRATASPKTTRGKSGGLFRPKPPRRPQWTFPTYPKPANPGKMSITIKNRDNKPAFNLHVIIGIAAAGLLLLIIIAVVIKLCVCDKRKTLNNTGNPQEDSNKFSVHKNEHPIQRRHNLPGHMAASPTPSVPHLQSNAKGAEAALSSKHRRYELQSHRSMRRSFPNTDESLMTNPVPAGHMHGTLMPVEGGYIFYCPTSNGVSTFPLPANTVVERDPNNVEEISVDEGYGTAKTAKPRSQSFGPVRPTKEVPTLKRKFSQWEKNQIKKGTLRL